MVPGYTSILRRLRGAHIALLIALDEEESLSKAADRVGISQPAATKALHEIEDLFGAQLFNRFSSGIEPNELGRSVVRGARRLRAEVMEMRRELTQILSGAGARLSVGVVMGAIPSVLLGAVRDLHRAYPSLSVEVHEGTSANLLWLLDNRTINVAIARTSVSSHPEAYTSVALNPESLVLVVGPDSPLGKRPVRRLKDLPKCRWLVFPSQMPMRSLLEAAFTDAGIEFPVNVIETESTFVTTTFLGDDPNLIAVLPDSVAGYLSERGQVRVLPTPIPRRAEPYELVTRSGTAVNPVLQVFMDACVRRRDGNIL